MPLRYDCAPLLISEFGSTDFPKFKRYISGSMSEKWRHRLSSKCRSLARPLPDDVAAEIIQVFDARFINASAASIASTYLDAIPAWRSWRQWSEQNRPVKKQDRVFAYQSRHELRIDRLAVRNKSKKQRAEASNWRSVNLSRIPRTRGRLILAQAPFLSLANLNERASGLRGHWQSLPMIPSRTTT
jgi:hypothetical protein